MLRLSQFLRKTQWKRLRLHLDLIEPNLEDDAQFFIEEEDENPIESEPLDELLEPPKPIEHKPLP